MNFNKRKDDLVCVSAVRTPFGRFGGSLKDIDIYDLGAIATGHANTASGARIMMTAAYNLKENGGGFAACAICGGLTQGAGAIIWVD